MVKPFHRICNWAVVFVVSVVLILLATLTPALSAGTNVLAGKVVGVHDGDTITVLDASRVEPVEHKIRLHGIDAPELGQPFGENAKKELSEQVFGKAVSVRITGTDRFRRSIGDVYEGKKWVNLEMVAYGMAWHSTEYSKSPELAKAQESAQTKKLGLWKDKAPTPPWDFRKEGKKR